jgi:Xaa-Pro dipeptidase
MQPLPTVDPLPHWPDHLAQLERDLAWALEESQAHGGEAFGGVVLDAGSPANHHADDQHPPHRPVPHFARWCPDPGPGHLLVARPGARPRLVRLVARDFWHEAPEAVEHPFADTLEVVEVDSAEAAVAAVGDTAGCAYVGARPAVAEALGLADAVEPGPLLAALDWRRAYKTDYEVACLRAAAERAARGHAAVRAGVQEGLSERALHFAYLEATGHLGHETPYPNIIAWDEASAVLHYTRKRPSAPQPGRVLLIDAGAQHLGYASDITRTYAREALGAPPHPAFVALLEGVQRLQRELVAMAAPGASYVAIHEASYRGVCALLAECELLTVSAEEACERNLGYAFYPHGVGHHLGLQVHDVGGRQAGPGGGAQDPPERFPWLRTTRSLEAGHVVTIEPGLYLIPLLLDPHRDGEHRDAFNWGLIDALLPHGGIRIEDDVAVTGDGPDDLSRPFVP